MDVSLDVVLLWSQITSDVVLPSLSSTRLSQLVPAPPAERACACSTRAGAVRMKMFSYGSRGSYGSYGFGSSPRLNQLRPGKRRVDPAHGHDDIDSAVMREPIPDGQ